MKTKNLAFLILWISFIQLASCEKHHDPGDDEEMEISSKCAMVLVGASVTVGAGATYALTPAAICTMGFCPIGVTGGSYAAWWQSTMQVVKAGTLFSKLQALAMGGVGLKTITIAGGTVGGVVGMSYLKKFCTLVDDADPDSVFGKAVDTSVLAVTKAFEMKELLATECASSESCQAVLQATSTAMGHVIKGSVLAGEKMRETGEYLATNCESSETCMAAVEAGTTAAAKLSKAYENLIKQFK